MPAQKYARIGTVQTIAAGTATSTGLTAVLGAFTTAIRITAVSAFRFNIGAAGLLIPAAGYALCPAGQYYDLNVSPGQTVVAMADSVTTVVSVMEHA